MDPKFCPPCKTSLPNYLWKLKWTLIGPHLSPHPNTDSNQTFTTGPFWLRQELHDYAKPFFPFCTFSTRTCFRDSVPKKGGEIWGPLAYLPKQLDLIMLGWLPSLQALAATTLLIPEAQKLTQNSPLNCMFTSFLQRFTPSSGFPLSSPWSTTEPPRTFPRPIPFFYAL